MSDVSSAPPNLSSTYLRIRGADAGIEPLPTGSDFWPRLMSGALGTFHNEFLVTTLSYDKPWPSWERHPNGDELVLLLEGRATFVLESDGGERTVELAESGDYVLVPRGTWHTSRGRTACRLLFVTAGEGTEIRPTAAPEPR